MSSVLADSNVILDVLADDPVWGDWSEDALGEYGETHTLMINSIIFSEVSVGYERIEEVDHALSRFQMVEIPKEALFLAGKAFVAYHRRGGSRWFPLPDFFIGAHAAVEGIPLLMRDVSRYQTDFPSLELIYPEDD